MTLKPLSLVLKARGAAFRHGPRPAIPAEGTPPSRKRTPLWRPPADDGSPLWSAVSARRAQGGARGFLWHQLEERRGQHSDLEERIAAYAMKPHESGSGGANAAGHANAPGPAD
jgi:hypothetical protein